MIALRRVGYYLTFCAACVLFGLQIVKPSVQLHGTLVPVACAVVVALTLYIRENDRDFLVTSVSLRGFMFFAGGLGLTSLFFRS